MTTENVNIKIVVDGQDAVLQLNKLDKTSTETTDALDNVAAASKKVSTALGETGKEIKTQEQLAGRGRMAFGQLGYAINDAAVFAVDFRMGIMAIGNNIPFVVQNLMALKSEAKETGVTFGSVLKSSLTGSGGVILAINILMTALTILPSLFKKSSEAAQENALQIKNLKKEYDSLTFSQLNNALQEIKLDKASLFSAYPTSEKYTEYSAGINATVTKTRYFSQEDIIKRMSAEDKKRLDELNAREKVILETTAQRNANVKSILSGSFDLSTENKINEALRIMGEEAADLNKTQRKSYDEMSEYLQKKLNDITGVSKSLTKEEKDAIADYKSYLEAKKEIVDELSLMDKDQYAKDKAELKKWYDEKFEIIKKDLQAVNDLKELYAKKDKELLLKSIRDNKQTSFMLNDNTYLWNSDLSLMDIRPLSQDYSQGMPEYTKKEYIEDWKEVNSVATFSINSINAAGLSMWDKFIIGSRTAKNEWDAIWLEMRNNALARLGEVVSNYLFDQVFSTLSGANKAYGGSSGGSGSGGGGFLSDILSFVGGLIPFLDSGGIVTKPTLAMIGERRSEAVIPLDELHKFTSQKISVNNNVNLSGSLEVGLNKLKVKLDKQEELKNRYF